MIKPTIYKSISVSDIKLRTAVSLTTTEKNQVVSILQRLTELIKVKHT